MLETLRMVLLAVATSNLVNYVAYSVKFLVYLLRISLTYLILNHLPLRVDIQLALLAPTAAPPLATITQMDSLVWPFQTQTTDVLWNLFDCMHKMILAVIFK